ncbi:MAG: formate dehydrogenase accessory sulfurtransferase FdhD [Bacteroidia bacterium]|nr:formate dehydrogenase accessory sulfurtransferase FdhD [Bacteroidia bacterium]
MNSTSVLQASKFTPAGKQEVHDVLTNEAPLQIHVNGEPFSVTMRTPGFEKELVRGILHSENVFTRKELELRTQTMTIDDEGNVTTVNAVIPEDQFDFGFESSRSLTSVSSCGICGKEDLSSIELCGLPLTDNSEFTLRDVNNMFDEMARYQEAFIASGGCHASAAFDQDGELLVLREDIGRHNAVDKVIGHLIDTGKVNRAKILLVSGRVSYEIVSKAYYAGIPVLAAISAPSTLAVNIAEQFGVSLLGFCRKDKLTAFSHAQRIR